MAELKNRIDLESYFPYLLRSISSRIGVGTSTIVVGDFRIGMREWRILAQMADKGPITNKDITDASGMDKASVSRALKYLEEQSLIEAAPSVDGNWRSKPYDLTNTGVEVYNHIAGQKLERADSLWGDMTPEEQQELIRLLQKLKKNVFRVLNDQA